MSISANFKKILRDYNYLYESLSDVKEISSIAEGEFRQAMIDSGDKEALQALIPNESQQTKLNEIKEEEKEKEPIHNDIDFKKLFRKIVIKCHPDKNKDATEKQLEFLKECYENATLANNVYDWGLLLRVASQLDVDLSDVDEKQIQNIKLKNEELQKEIQKYESSMAYQWYTKDDAKTRERFLAICLDVFKSSLKPKEN
jgi:hypothetical protein